MPVKKLSKWLSPYTAYDMAGNVWEWVNSVYLPYPYTESDRREDLSSDGARVLRGGSWSNIDIVVRSAYRSRKDPLLSDRLLGFRCSRPQ
ncbi:MAG: SUMF1/EgtB/PvdO family nonheme iron enzyme [Anaerolineales bacterium]|nr:SUMF1/EgtB/PvdO family nonheme iron enzyme [Anaerolineales bacterium]